jgi:hypothetical protein
MLKELHFPAVLTGAIINPDRNSRASQGSNSDTVLGPPICSVPGSLAVTMYNHEVGPRLRCVLVWRVCALA